MLKVNRYNTKYYTLNSLEKRESLKNFFWRLLVNSNQFYNFNHLNLPIIVKYLEQRGIIVRIDSNLKGNLKQKISLQPGTINLYINERLSMQGVEASLYQDLLELDEHIGEFKKQPATIFIDYAFKFKTNKDKIQRLLTSWGFRVLVLEDLPAHGNHLLTRLESTIYSADYGLVLLTADDKIENQNIFHPRPNVMLEMGMLLTHLRDKEKRLTIVNFDSNKVQIPSDIFGISYIAIDSCDNYELELKLMNELYHLYNITNKQGVNK